MQRELTISLSEETYNGLMNLVGEQNASQFIEAALHSCLKNAREEYAVELPRHDGKKVVRIHSPRVVDRSLAERLKVEIIEENANA